LICHVTKLDGGTGFAAIGDMPQLNCQHPQKYHRVLGNTQWSFSSTVNPDKSDKAGTF
jgi:hypothetical protein